ncbi:DUF5701 family protein [Branchiibius sp. NY16-3462-2]|uniref:DUF5701 family protein n=1 Tax=Branchiibius sp. NY16-3462-2 TaxID=1807500 RepID=UPI00079CA2BF|nr:DUF5701 family protein [Branchiibius sp. NY16-3462-2]KYH43738.1 hypothetical protein AZH51_02780 [Branchiibius sp. NY16-3462-2]
MALTDDLDRLIALGLPILADLTDDQFRSLADGLPDREGGTLMLHPDFIPAERLVPLLRGASGQPGFIVEDLTDLASFVTRPEVTLPDRSLYMAVDPQRGDELRNQSPDEAWPALVGAGRSPMTVHEGISWLLHRPELLEPNYCFMTIGTRRPKTNGWDARTPALWISGGTGRDGRERTGAPKLGWCWAGNRHTWLGFGSVADRVG